MTLINVRTAAQLTAKDRSTIIRAIEDGRLSATRDERSRYQIDPAELERVYGKLRSPDAHDDASRDAVPQSASADALRAAGLEREVALLREMLERERRSFDEERTFLRGLADKQADQVRQLTDQRDRERHSPSLFRWFRRIS